MKPLKIPSPPSFDSVICITGTAVDGSKPEIRSSNWQETAFPFCNFDIFLRFEVWHGLSFLYLLFLEQIFEKILISNLSTGTFIKWRAGTGLSRRALQPSSGGTILKMSVSSTTVVVIPSFRKLIIAVILRANNFSDNSRDQAKDWRDYISSLGLVSESKFSPTMDPAHQNHTLGFCKWFFILLVKKISCV